MTAIFICAATALILAVIAWSLQLVQLPLLPNIGRPEFSEYVRAHRRRNTFLMAGPMVVEAIASIWTRGMLPWAALIVIWAITFLRITPLFAKLVDKYDEDVIASLRQWNLMRSLLWTLRFVAFSFPILQVYRSTVL